MCCKHPSQCFKSKVGGEPQLFSWDGGIAAGPARAEVLQSQHLPLSNCCLTLGALAHPALSLLLLHFSVLFVPR